MVSVCYYIQLSYITEGGKMCNNIHYGLLYMIVMDNICINIFDNLDLCYLIKAIFLRFQVSVRFKITVLGEKYEVLFPQMKQKLLIRSMFP